jgi:hypothetical protein
MSYTLNNELWKWWYIVMYNSLGNFLDNVTSIKSIIDYDFKNESSVPEVANENVSIRKFKAYRTYDKDFDCDNSNGSCKLMDDIYENLWSWSYDKRYSINETLNSRMNVNWARYGTDTMNSFKSIYNQALKLYKSDEAKANNIYSLQKFAGLTHTVGNFTLVPFKLIESDEKSFNQYRGFNFGKYFVYDLFDLSLKIIKEEIGDDAFKKYIDVFYLNMYVDDRYNIKPLFKRHAKFLKQDRLDLSNPEEFLPKTKKELNEYLENVNANIEARSKIIGLRLIDITGKKTISITTDDKPKRSIFRKIDILFIVLFSSIYIAFVIHAINDMTSYVGGVRGAYSQFDSARVTKELLTVFKWWILRDSFLLAITLRLIIFGIGKMLWKCPHCKRKLVFRKVSDKKVGSASISVKVVNETKDLRNVTVGTTERYIPGTRHYYECIHKCRRCGYEKYRNFSYDKPDV